jgi:hypothetical protein
MKKIILSLATCLSAFFLIFYSQADEKPVIANIGVKPLSDTTRNWAEKFDPKVLVPTLDQMCPSHTPGNSIIQTGIQVKVGDIKHQYQVRKDGTTPGFTYNSLKALNRSDFEKMIVNFGAFFSDFGMGTCPSKGYFILQAIDDNYDKSYKKVLPYDVFTSSANPAVAGTSYVDGCHYRFPISTISTIIENVIKDDPKYKETGGKEGVVKLLGQACVSNSSNSWTKNFLIYFTFGQPDDFFHDEDWLAGKMVYNAFLTDHSDYSWPGFLPATP